MKVCNECGFSQEQYDELVNRAEAAEKRVKVLEKALRNYLIRKDNDENAEITCFEMEYGWDCPHRGTSKSCIECRFEYLIKQAQSEIDKEEGK